MKNLLLFTLVCLSGYVSATPLEPCPRSEEIINTYPTKLLPSTLEVEKTACYETTLEKQILTDNPQLNEIIILNSDGFYCVDVVIGNVNDLIKDRNCN